MLAPNRKTSTRNFCSGSLAITLSLFYDLQLSRYMLNLVDSFFYSSIVNRFKSGSLLFFCKTRWTLSYLISNSPLSPSSLLTGLSAAQRDQGLYDTLKSSGWEKKTTFFSVWGERSNYVSTSGSWYLLPFFTERSVICTPPSKKHTDICRLKNSIDLDWVVEKEEKREKDSFWLPSHHLKNKKKKKLDIKYKLWRCFLMRLNKWMTSPVCAMETNHSFKDKWDVTSHGPSGNITDSKKKKKSL